MKLVVDDHTTAVLVGHHCRVVLALVPRQLRNEGVWWGQGPGQGLAQGPGLVSARDQSGSAVGLGLGLGEGHRMWTPPPVSLRQRSELDGALLRCRLLAAKAGGVEWSLRGLLAPSLGGELRGGVLAALSIMAEHCHAFPHNKGQGKTQGQGQGQGQGQDSKKNVGGSFGSLSGGGSDGQWLIEFLALTHHQLPPLSKRQKKSRKHSLHENSVLELIDRDLLLLLAPSVEGPWRPRDFHTDPCPEGIVVQYIPFYTHSLYYTILAHPLPHPLTHPHIQPLAHHYHSLPPHLTHLYYLPPFGSIETTLVAAPLHKLLNRATSVLQLYPGNELLLQVVKVAARIVGFPSATPLGKLLISVQLLLGKAQVSA